MQEVFLRLVKSGRAPNQKAPLLHWMYRVTTNLCLNRLRKRRTHPVVFDPEVLRRLVSPEDAEGRQVDRQAVFHVMSRCDELTQQVAVHYFLDEMNMEEVARVVGRSRKTVSRKLALFERRARKLLEERA